MRALERFSQLLPAAPTRELAATLVRRVPLLAMIESAPLDFLFTSARAYRFNPRGVECVYFAEEEVTAAAEYELHNPGRYEPFVTYFAEVRLGRVLDLCDAATRAAVGMSVEDLHAPWVGARAPTPAQLLGTAVNAHSVVAAIRFPSVAAQSRGFSGANVVIFRDCVQHPDAVHILGPTRKPLQKWP